jgi:4-hydroxy-3-polyprenylbenzoate decarboxylase
MEDCWMASAASRLILALVQVDLPQIVSLFRPLSGIFHGGTVVSVKDANGNGGELISRIRKTRWLSRSRLIILVDDGQEPSDLSGVYWRVMNNVDWKIDLVFAGTGLGIDATVKTCGRSPALPPLKIDQAISDLVEKKWHEYGFNENR